MVTTNKGRKWRERDHTLAIDFDGVLHEYDRGWQGGELYGCAVKGAVVALEKLQDAGYTILVYSTRAETSDDRLAMLEWMLGHGFKNMDAIEITDKKPPALAYIDDRAVRFTTWADMTKMWV